MKSLANKVAVITGGTTGIGFATAKKMKEEGATVIITGRTKASLEAAEKELGVKGFISDQGKLSDIDDLVKEVSKSYSKVDILFINAGLANFMPVESATEEHYDAIMNINVKGAFFTAQKFIPILNEGSSIILNTSVNAVLGAHSSGVYSASKGALLSLNRVLAAELAPKKIRVNAVSPGPVDTPIYGKLGLSNEAVNEFASVLSKKILLNRFGQSEEIAKTVSFLASDDAAFINGTELVIDGGLTVNTLS